MSVSSQVRSLLPGTHVALWIALVYTLVATAAAGYPLVVLLVGTCVSGAVGVAVFRVAHRAQFAELVHIATRVLGRGGTRPVAAQGAGGV